MHNPLTPFSTFSNKEINAADLEFMQRRQSIESVIKYIVDLWKDDVDINDISVQNQVFAYYGLNDLTDQEIAEITSCVEKLLS